jgi:hypothetical protein
MLSISMLEFLYHHIIIEEYGYVDMIPWMDIFKIEKFLEKIAMSLQI